MIKCSRQKNLHIKFPLSKGHKYPKVPARVYNIIPQIYQSVNTFLQKNLVYNRRDGKFRQFLPSFSVSFKTQFLQFLQKIINICPIFLAQILYFVIFRIFAASLFFG